MFKSPWIGKAVVVAGTLLMIAIRRPYEKRSGELKVRTSRRGKTELVLLSLMGVGFLLPAFAALVPLFNFADYQNPPVCVLAGGLMVAISLWLFTRSHRDLGNNWWVTLEVRYQHDLVTRGVYRHVRHAMYLVFFLHACGETLALGNWLAGPSYVFAVLILFAFRVGPEERMMKEQFGSEYEAYCAGTKRLIPWVL